MQGAVTKPISLLHVEHETAYRIINVIQTHKPTKYCGNNANEINHQVQTPTQNTAVDVVISLQ